MFKYPLTTFTLLGIGSFVTVHTDQSVTLWYELLIGQRLVAAITQETVLVVVLVLVRQVLKYHRNHE